MTDAYKDESSTEDDTAKKLKLVEENSEEEFGRLSICAGDIANEVTFYNSCEL